MTLTEKAKVAKELIGWFDSKGLSPADGLLVMTYVIGVSIAMVKSDSAFEEGCKLASEAISEVAKDKRTQMTYRPSGQVLN